MVQQNEQLKYCLCELQLANGAQYSVPLHASLVQM